VDLSTIANVATALTVLTGVGFGLVEARRSRKDREERAAFAALDAILTPDWMKSIVIVHAIPEGTTAADIEANPRVLEAAHIIGITLEGLGYAVFARIVPLKTVDDLVGGSVRVAWRNMRQYVEFERNRAGSQKSWEWFQWLAEQLERHGTSRTNLGIGAYVVYRDWKP
jgi:hypothetical protein